jgi:hypothetical protein
MSTTSAIKPTVLVLLFAIIFSLSTFEYWQTWKKGQGSPFTWDVELYYSYLPATFIHQDLSFNYSDKLPMQKLPNGNKNPKYTCGMAIMYAPFFLMGHKIAINQKNSLDGYSEPYATMIHFGSIFYVMLGLFFLRKVLLLFYSENISALLLFISFFGTNLFFYTLREGEYTHGYLFFLVSVFLYLLIKWHAIPKQSTSIFLGLVIGLITLIRPTDCLFFIIFLFYGVTGKETFKTRMQLFLTHKWKLLTMVLFGFLMLSPQLIFWKIHMGSFLFFSYNNEGFFWGDPKIVEVLFSYRKGWLVYTPVMAFSIIGIFYMKHYVREIRFGLILFFILNLYVISCWWCWWYGGGFGMRALVETYPLMLLPLGAFLQKLFSGNSTSVLLTSIKKYGILVCIMFFVCLNIIQTYQCKMDMIHFDSMKKATYWLVFGKFEFNGDDKKHYYESLAKIDYEKAVEGTGRDDN